MLSELSLGHIESRVSSYRKILEPVSNVNDNEISEEPQQKKMKRDEQGRFPWCNFFKYRSSSRSQSSILINFWSNLVKISKILLSIILVS